MGMIRSDVRKAAANTADAEKELADFLMSHSSDANMGGWECIHPDCDVQISINDENSSRAWKEHVAQVLIAAGYKKA